MQGRVPWQLVRGLLGLGAHLLGVVPLLVCSLGSKHGRRDAIGQGVAWWQLGLHLSADPRRSCR